MKHMCKMRSRGIQVLVSLLICGTLIVPSGSFADAGVTTSAPTTPSTVTATTVPSTAVKPVPSNVKLPQLTAKEIKVLKIKGDAYFKALSLDNRFSGSVLVTQNGKTIYEGAYGLANRTYDQPNKLDSKYLVGSVSKQFTAAAILKLNEQGLLTLTDPVSKYFPDFPNGDTITLHQLLTHTSGIKDFTMLFNKDFNYARQYSVMDLIGLFSNLPLSATPGSKYEYNNSDYVLLGAVVEKVSGMTLEKYMTDNFFKPLGMTQTGFFKNSDINKNLSSGYKVAGQIVQNGQYMDSSLAYGCGMLYSNIYDLSKWNQALYGNKVLSANSTKMMTSVQVKISGTYAGYGYGLSTGKEFNRTYTGHNGDVSGYTAHNYTYVDQNISIIILTNIERLKVYNMAMDLTPMIFNEAVIAPVEPQAFKLTPEEYNNYTGTYHSDKFGVDVLVNKEGEKLSALTAGFDKVYIVPTSKIKFISVNKDAIVEFSDLREGKFQKAVILPAGLILTRVK